MSSLSQEAIGPNPLLLKFAVSSTALSAVASSSAQSAVSGEEDLHGSSCVNLKFWILDVRTDSGFVSEYCSQSAGCFSGQLCSAVGEQELQHCLPFKQVHVPRGP